MAVRFCQRLRDVSRALHAWVASGVLVALAIQQGGEVAPGPIAWLGAGIAGLIAVVVAGWTTANPTIYRAGLAMQTITPNWKR